LQVKGKLIVPPQFKNRLVVVNGQVLEYGEPDQLLLNDGKGHFTPVSWTDGRFVDEDGNRLTQPPLDWGLTATFRDINNDGFPDIYVCNDYWTPDRIWINDGKGNFRAIARLALRATSSSSMGVDFADVDRDGNVDFFVVDMLSRDLRLRKRQKFAQIPMALPVGAIDNRPQIMRNTLFHNRGDGTYAEIANYSSLAASDWSWQPIFLDVDLDGYEDLLVSAGNSRDVQDLDAEVQIKSRQHSWKGFTNAVERQKAFTTELMMHRRLYPELKMPIVTFKNLSGFRFQETTRIWGTENAGSHHGIALADFDGDGDLDFVANNLGSVAGVYRNDTVAARVAVRLKGLPPNTQGIGAKIKLLNGAVLVQSQEVVAGGRYTSGSDPMLVFAAGKTAGEMILEVSWRGGKLSTVRNVGSNRVYEVEETGASEGGALERRSVGALERQSVGASELRSFGALEAQGSENHAPRSTLHAPTFFEDVSVLLQHTHHEEEFDDYARQPLLPYKLSQLGPGVTWFDLDGDGHDDLIVGTGRGGQMAAYRNNGGEFRRITGAPFDAPATRDQTTVLGWHQPGGQSVVLAGSANYEDGLAVGGAVRQYDLALKVVYESFPGHQSSTGPMSLADMDGDGNLDLFIGGRVVPGRWPEAASSRIYRHDGKQWSLDAENSRLLEKVGLVSGAVWSDLDGDGFPELILACEWGPIRIFQNAGGKLREVTADLGLTPYTGLWTSVSTGDIDGDGKLDVIAGNWGHNSPYQATSGRPLLLYYGDLGGRGLVDLIETEYDPSNASVLPRRMLDPLSASLPFLLGRFAGNRAFSETTVERVLDEQKLRATQSRANTLASTIFFNRGGRFEAVELPREAQLAPVFGINVGDFDGDGHEDIFLSQNFFETQPEIPRLDAGRGLWLKGDGTPNLRPVPGQESGIAVYGEQRGSALADFTEDGRVDLVVTQNGAPTRLFKNVSAKPGLRVRLAGPPGNPNGVGATIRPLFGQRFGPTREIHGGSGYWSQDSAVQVLGTPELPTQIWIRWPGGKSTTTDVPPNVAEVTINSTGTLISSRIERPQ
ncbi:MAG: VCBS repeat-containing protein, partial [Verrucomicrobiota bacterium]